MLAQGSLYVVVELDDELGNLDSVVISPRLNGCPQVTFISHRRDRRHPLMDQFHDRRQGRWQIPLVGGRVESDQMRQVDGEKAFLKGAGARGEMLDGSS